MHIALVSQFTHEFGINWLGFIGQVGITTIVAIARLFYFFGSQRAISAGTTQKSGTIAIATSANASKSVTAPKAVSAIKPTVSSGTTQTTKQAPKQSDVTEVATSNCRSRSKVELRNQHQRL